MRRLLDAPSEAEIGFKIRNVCEVGYNAGHGAAAWLEPHENSAVRTCKLVSEKQHFDEIIITAFANQQICIQQFASHGMLATAT